MNTLPDALFIVDVGYHKIAVAEAQAGHPDHRRGGLQPLARGHRLRDPGHDDSAKAVTLYVREMADSHPGKARATPPATSRRAVAEGSDEFVEVKEGASA